MEHKTKKGNSRVTTARKNTYRSDELDLLDEMVRVRQEAIERAAQMETVADKIGKAAAPDASPPATVAQKVEAVGVTKGELNTLSTVLLGILAGVFIGLGAMACTVVTTNTGLGFGVNKLLGGIIFCLGLVLVVLAGAELFTGNSLIVMSWISGRTSFTRLLRNWGLVYVANFAGALSLAGLIYYTYQWTFSSYGVGANALLIANSKVNLSFGTALIRGILCNVMVCLAVWLCFGARTAVDKIMAIIFPITAFVMAGFEHSVANMYFIPVGILMAGQPEVLAAAGVTAEGIANLTWTGFFGNLIPVTIGNIIGGAILIGVVYWMAYLRRERAVELATSRPWLRKVAPGFVNAVLRRAAPAALAEPIRAQLEELIRTRMDEPIALDTGGKALLAVLAKASDDSHFLAKLADNPEQALGDYDLTPEEKAALVSGDIRWIESKLGKLDEPLRTWLTARLTQEKW